MFTDFLWLMGAKHQHDRQAELGLAGLMGILSVIFMAWKWDSIFYPILNKLGLVAMAQRIGLIGEIPILTVMNTIALIFVFCLFIGLISITLVVLSLFLGGTKLGHVVLGTAALLFFLPFIVTFEISKQIRRLFSPNGNGTLNDTYKRDKELRPLLYKYHKEPEEIKMFKLFEEQIKRTDDSGSVAKITKSELKSILNRTVASLDNDKDWQFGYDKWEKQWYLLFYNPLPEFASPCANRRFSNTHNNLFDFPKQDTKGFLENSNSRESEGFFVPSIKIDFIWKDEKIVPVAVESAYFSEVRNTKHMDLYTLQGKAVDSFFNEVSKDEHVNNTIHYAHMVLYLIPIAFRGHNHTLADERYNKAMRAVPGATQNFNVYENDVREQIDAFVKQGHQWASDWITETEINKRRLHRDKKLY